MVSDTSNGEQSQGGEKEGRKWDRWNETWKEHEGKWRKRRKHNHNKGRRGGRGEGIEASGVGGASKGAGSTWRTREEEKKAIERWERNDEEKKRVKYHRMVSDTSNGEQSQGGEKEGRKWDRWNETWKEHEGKWRKRRKHNHNKGRRGGRGEGIEASGVGGASKGAGSTWRTREEEKKAIERWERNDEEKKRVKYHRGEKTAKLKLFHFENFFANYWLIRRRK